MHLLLYRTLGKHLVQILGRYDGREKSRLALLWFLDRTLPCTRACRQRIADTTRRDHFPLDTLGGVRQVDAIRHLDVVAIEVNRAWCIRAGRGTGICEVARLCSLLLLLLLY